MASGPDDLAFSDLEEYSDDSDLERMENEEFDTDKEIGQKWKSTSGSSISTKVAQSKHLNDMKVMLGLDEFKQKTNNKRERKRRAKARAKAAKADGHPASVIKTLATKLKSSVSAPEIIEYEDARRSRAKARAQNNANQSLSDAGSGRSGLPTEADPGLSMKEARFEVFKFGVRGFGKEDRQNAELRELIRLGAKPPKKPCLPYSELKAQRKIEKEAARKAQEIEKASGMKNIVKRNPQSGGQVQKTNKKKGSKIRDSIQTKMGQFNGGMLKLSAKDIAKLRGKS